MLPWYQDWAKWIINWVVIEIWNTGRRKIFFVKEIMNLPFLPPRSRRVSK